MPTDYFEMMVTSIRLTPDERRSILDKRKKQCICDICPTYRECVRTEQGAGEAERAFCTVGGSACIVNEHECLCSTCPLSREMELSFSYYCTRGSEAQQRVREVIGLR
ncbi:MAG: DUF2769 domain-containing protein [Methanomicrobiales archaeon]|nr:DUF2769 domain-containing protein [Methanomicrobiales archaeon]